MVAGLMQPISTGAALQKNRLLIKISFAFLFGNERSVIIGGLQSCNREVKLLKLDFSKDIVTFPFPE